MEQNKNRLHCCCFTGHRPSKLAYSENEIKFLLEKAIDYAISKGYTTFITGMAPGTDIWAAEIIIEKKKYNENLHLICAVPHPGFENRKSSEKARYAEVIENSDCVHTVCDHYFRACYQRRNEFMVDNSGLVIAVWNGTASGTKNTVDYAKRQGVRVINVLQKATGSCFSINFCAEHMASERQPAEQIRSYLSDMLPKLNYWKDK